MSETTAANSLDRMLGVLDVFTEEQPTWTAEQIIARLGYSRATAYRYLKSLAGAGLLAPAANGAYMLGPRIVQFDRQIRLTDPLLNAGQRVMEALKATLPTTLLLCSFYGDTVLCIHEERGEEAVESSYVRGRPMPLFRGATSKIILSHLPSYQLRSLMLHRGREIAEAGLGDDWSAFRETLKKVRRTGHCIAHGEVDPGMVGVAVPVFLQKAIIGSLSAVFSEARFDKGAEADAVRLLMGAAERITNSLDELPQAEDGARVLTFPSSRSLVASGGGRR